MKRMRIKGFAFLITAVFLFMGATEHALASDSDKSTKPCLNSKEVEQCVKLAIEAFDSMEAELKKEYSACIYRTVGTKDFVEKCKKSYDDAHKIISDLRDDDIHNCITNGCFK